MTAEPAPDRPCEWATCDAGIAEPGSLFCKPHGRQARQEGAPWRHIESAPESPLRAIPAAFTRPAPASPPARPLQPARATCRFCDQPPLEKTLTSRSNRWRNLCETHYAEARRNALGARRRAQLEEVIARPAPDATRDPAPIGGDVPVDPNLAAWRRAERVGGIGPDHGEACQPWCAITDHTAGPCRDSDGHDWRERTEHALATRAEAPAPTPPFDDAPKLVVAVPDSYTERAATLVELAARVDDARAELEAALAAWRDAIATLAT